MNRLKKILAYPSRWSRHVGGYLLAIATIAFVTLLSPHYVSFKYEYDLNRPWKYEDLYADSDIVLLKDPDALAEEKAQIEKDFVPHYAFDFRMAGQQIERYEAAFEKEYQALNNSSNSAYTDILQRPSAYKAFGKGLLTRLFEQGIIEIAPQHEANKDRLVVEVIRGNVKSREMLQALPQQADMEPRILDTLMHSRLKEAEFLFPLVYTSIKPNIYYSDSLTQHFLAIALKQVSASDDIIRSGERIVAAGEAVTPPIYNKLRSYEANYLKQSDNHISYWLVRLGYLILASVLILTYLMYLRNIQPEVFYRFRSLTFLLMWVALYAYLVHVVEKVDIISAYLIPFCIAPIIIKNFFNDRLALFTHLVVVLVVSFLSSLGYEFTFLQLIVGIVAVLTNTETRYWSRFFVSIFYIFLVYIVGYFGLMLIKGLQWEEIDGQVIGFLFGNAILLLLAYPLIPLLEKLFGFTSSITLAELSDLNRNLLKELSMRAPGTMQHSLQVANLSEAAARRINANALLVKTAALYHDIGKLKNPSYFIENQTAQNPHEQLSYAESAAIIIKHVEDGVRLAKKNHLPSVIIDFIKTHHGTTRVEYFYRTAVNDTSEEEVEESAFRYPGPKPKTKEQAILMIADSLEAAAKSLKNPESQDIQQLVDNIVAFKIKNAQFEETALTFEELEQCKKAFTRMLQSMHHLRIEYPEEKSPN